MANSFGSIQHQDMVEKLTALFTNEYLREIRKLDGVNDLDLVIWHLCNQWMQATQRSEQARNDAHLMQLQYVTLSCGMILNYLSNEQWEQWTDEALDHLSNLRTFNGSFLGYLWQTGEITSSKADFYNLLMWNYVLVEILGARAYELVHPVLEAKPLINLSICLDDSLGRLRHNYEDFCVRHKVTAEDVNFVKRGFAFVQAQPKGSSWSEYYAGAGLCRPSLAV